MPRPAKDAPVIRRKRTTPRTVLMEGHYRKLGADRPWTNREVNRLCRRLRMTPFELGALFCIPIPRFQSMIEANEFPPWVALHFRMLESWYLETIVKLPQEAILPVSILVTGASHMRDKIQGEGIA